MVDNNKEKRGRKKVEIIWLERKKNIYGCSLFFRWCFTSWIAILNITAAVLAVQLIQHNEKDT